MKNDQEKNYTTIAVYIIITVIVIVIAVFLLLGARDYIINKQYSGIFKIMTPFIYGFILAYLLNPLQKFFKTRIFSFITRKKSTPKRTKTQKIVSIIATYLLCLIFITLLIFMIIPQIGTSINQLADRVKDMFSPYETVSADLNPIEESEDFPQIVINEKSLANTKIGKFITENTASLQKFIDDIGIRLDIEETVNSFFISFTADIANFTTKYITPLFNKTAAILYSTATGILNVFLGILISIYILMSKDIFIAQTKKLFAALFSHSFNLKAIELTRKTHGILGEFITGKILDSLIIGIICFICMSVFNINYAMLISVIIGITNVIPFFGPFIGAIPSIFFLLINDPLQALWFTVFIIILQQIDGNIIGPKIISSSIGLSSFWVIFSILFMNGIFGLFGMFVGVPIFAVIYIIIKEFIEEKLSKKGMPVETSEYITAENTDLLLLQNKEKIPFSTRLDNFIKKISERINKNK